MSGIQLANQYSLRAIRVNLSQQSSAGKDGLTTFPRRLIRISGPTNKMLEY